MALSMRPHFGWGLAVAWSLGVLGMVGSVRSAESDPLIDEDRAAAVEKDVTQGALRIVQKDGSIIECPLKHTDVQAEVAGFIARVRVTQTFHNPTKEKIEAVYVFPLPHEAAVDAMTMVVGERRITGEIKRRAEARAIYDEALRHGQTAALLEQERPNIFTQSVGNIEPGQEVKIEISYVDVLRYDMGTYEFRFPMVVGPRYIPGTPSGAAPPTPAPLEGKVSPPVADTDRVPDASRISPPVLKPGVRSGHDISLTIKLDAGVPIQHLSSPNHQADITKAGERAATIKLDPADSLPNKDFVLRYGVVGKKPEMALLAHTGEYSPDSKRYGSGYFMLMIQPQEDERLTKSPPRELVFLVDVSGSMSGEPTAKVIEAMQGMLKLCRPQDTVQVITFAGEANKLFDKPVPVTEENIAKALGFSSTLRGSGGTEMLKGVKMAIDEPIDKERLRIVVMLTDGYIGNEAEIIEHVGKHCGDQIRFWCVGIGSSPNMFLVDGVAKQGGGMGKQLALPDETTPLVQEIMTRIQRAQLAKVHIDWGGLQVAETFPAKIPELWAGRPIIVFGRYTVSGMAKITIRGNVEGTPVSWPVSVQLPASETSHDVLAKTWARQKIEELMQQTFYQGSPAVEESVTAIALDYRLMSPFTSFVAVDSATPKSPEAAQPPRRMLVPVPLPQGTRWEGFFGDEAEVVVDNLSLRDGSLRLQSARRVRGDDHRVLRESLKKQEQLSRSITPRLAARAATPLSQAGAPRGGALAPGMGAGGGTSFYSALPAPHPTGNIGGYLPATKGERRKLASERFSRLKADAYFLAPADGELAELSAEQLESTHEALVAGGEKLAERAQQLYTQATERKESLAPGVARQLLMQACLFDTAAAQLGHSEGQVADAAIERLRELHAEHVLAWAKSLPALSKRLDLVLRDQSLEQALAQVAKAVGVDVRLLPGSGEDVAALVGGDAPRVTYLDLRNATVSQALDWILQPARLTWWVDGQKIVAASERRRSDDSTWVYDVSAIALPLAEDLRKLKDGEKATAQARQAAEEFLSAVRDALRIDPNDLAWFGPGQLLVIGDGSLHAKVAALFATLEKGEQVPPGIPAGLVTTTKSRFAARTADWAKHLEAERKWSVAAAHEQFSWQLAAAAVNGRVDLEALTELQIAWNAPQTAALLETAPVLLVRSLWSVCEAARSLPENKELAALAALARQQSGPFIGTALAAAAKEPTDMASLMTVLYAIAANPGDPAFGKVRDLVAVRKDDNEATAIWRTIGRVLLGSPSSADREALVAVLDKGFDGEDTIALAALACRQGGPELWGEFRAHARQLLDGQPLPGELVVLVNSL
ncbi:MAG: VIT domain-containing protein [Pirellulaceae bacterium]|nr:VIT domain-containing protein [Pirellulaceae bacterium]